MMLQQKLGCCGRELEENKDFKGLKRRILEIFMAVVAKGILG